MKRFRYPPALFGGLSVVVLASFGGLALQFYQARMRAEELTASREAVLHTYKVLDELSALDQALQDGERGQRGYLITGKADYLVPYKASLEDIPFHLRQLTALTIDNPEQQRRWPVLAEQVRFKTEEMERTVAAFDAKGFDAAREIVQTDIGLNAMKTIGGLIAAARATETQLLDERTAATIDADRNTTRLAVVSGVFSFITIVAGLTFAFLAFRNLARAGRELAQSRAQLAQSQKLESLGQLTGGIAHDFNNLLQGITGAVSILRRKLPALDPDAAKWLEMISRSADRAASLTQRLLAFSRRQPLNPRPLRPNDLLNGLTELLKQSLGENIAVQTVAAAGAWVVEADPNELETAILNLAINARDAMPNGGKLTLETSNAFLEEAYAKRENVKSGQYAMIAVTDTGAGMAPDVVEKVFEPFFTTKPVGKGTGLGLSQVYGFVKQSLGHIKIYSELGHGTTVKIYLPRYMGAMPAELEQAAQPVAQRVQRAESILVVEDDGDVRNFIASVLADDGYQVTVMHDAESALSYLQDAPLPTLILTDVGLPGKNGRQLADEARQQWPALRVVFMTGYARNAIVHGGRLDPGVDLIVKPFSERALTDKLREVLDRRH